jgi:hypothetical protein
MTSPPDSGDVEEAPKTAEARPVQTRRPRWWIAAITFVGGFVFGVVAVGLLNAGTPNFPSGTGPGGAPAPTSSLGPSPGGSFPVVAEAKVNAACLAVINGAQDMYAILTGLPQAVSDVDLQQLDDIVRSLQPIVARLGPDLQDCKVDTSVVSNPTEATAPQPTSPQPTVTPTR